MLKEFGHDLKVLRESKGITISEISAQTRINPKFITNIEDGIFDFQPDTYIRAFLREYASCINENEHKLLNDYEKAKSGFYGRKSKGRTIIPPPEKKNNIETRESESKTEIPVQEIRSESYSNQKISSESFASSLDQRISYAKPKTSPFSKPAVQKFILGIVIFVALIGSVYLLFFLNRNDNDHTNIKPQKFSETVNNYETKIKGKTEKVQDPVPDSSKTETDDSLKLTMAASKDVRIKVYIDESQVIEDFIPAKDSLTVKAKDKFRFSASANSSIDLYLNGKRLKKPATLMGTSIKNLIIDKDGIVNE